MITLRNMRKKALTQEIEFCDLMIELAYKPAKYEDRKKRLQRILDHVDEKETNENE